MKKITVVTVCFNCVGTIEQTIRSVISQDYPELEYVIIDGASQDGTLDIVNKYQTKIKTIVSEPDKGIFDAMNKSLKYITGYYVLFLNAGDKLVSSHIVSDIFGKQEHHEDLIYGDVYIQNELGYLFCKADAIYSKKPTKKELVFKSQGFCHQSLFTKTSMLKNIGFNLRYPLGADYDTTAQIYYKGNQEIFYVGQPISVFDDRTGGASHNKIVQILKERADFFGYKPLVYVYLYAYKEIISNKVKAIIERLFPDAVRAQRMKKYKVEI